MWKQGRLGTLVDNLLKINIDVLNLKADINEKIEKERWIKIEILRLLETYG